ncbi:MAG: sugar phosphate nucleotidyltransferase [Candidatus Zixiibacteriota bacterium]
MSNPAPINTAVILAGGEGRRLFPLTASLPKPLVPVGDRPVIEYPLEQLVRCGIVKVHVAVNHLADQIRETLGDGSKYGVQLCYHEEALPLSTIGPLGLIENLPETFFVMNGDVITNIDLRKVGASHQSSGAIMTVVVCPRTERIDFGVIETDETHTVSAFIEKPSYSYLVSSGIYCMSRRLLEVIPKGRRFGFDELVQSLQQRGERIHTYHFDGYWLDVGRPDDYERANREISDIRFDIK